MGRLGKLWEEWTALGVHLVEDGWKAPSGFEVFTDSGTYAPTFLVGSWTDAAGDTHVFLCDGYAATAEAMQAASLAEVLDVDASMALFSPGFELPLQRRGKADAARPRQRRTSRRESARRWAGGTSRRARSSRTRRRSARREPRNVPTGRPALRPDDFVPEKNWRVLASTGYICDDPYTGTAGVTRVDDGVYRVTTRLAAHQASSRIAFTFRLMEPLDRARHVFSPLLVRFMSGVDHTTRPVKISDSGRIRNELQTMFSQALEHDGETIRLHFDRLDEKVVPREKQETIRKVLEWYRANHPVWFDWIELAGVSTPRI